MKILLALIKKEFYQIERDFSSILIAFILPITILFLYRYGINLDTLKISIGIKNDDTNPKISTLIGSFDKSKYVKAKFYNNKNQMYDDIKNSKLRAGIIIPNDFAKSLMKNTNPEVLVITDGSESNLANFSQNYTQQIISSWYSNFRKNQNLINLESRFWYNQDINSHHFILPGSLAVTMNMIGMLLTALVVSREWERGTIEALFATKISKLQFILSKYIPYFILGISSLIFNIFLCIFVFNIPFRGNIFILIFVGGLYLFTCLGIGLVISTSYKEQFSASQVALSFGMLPAMLLSGLIYPISSMPKIFQIITSILPPRYFIIFIQSEFMAGTIPKIVIINSIYLTLLGIGLFLIVYSKINLRLEKC